MYLLLYQGILFTLWLSSCLIASVLAVDGDGSDLYGLNKYYLMHSPNFNMLAQDDPYESGTTVGIEFKNQNAVYMLSNENTIDPIIYSGMGLANVPYRYLVFNSDGKLLQQELFFRKPTNETTSDTYNRETNSIDTQLVEYLRVSYTYPGADEEVKYTPKLNRTAVHPYTEMYALSLFANEGDLKRMRENVLENIPITVNLTRITPEGHKKYTNVTFAIDGKSQRLWNKLSYSLDLPDDQAINGHQRFKLRSLSTDPSYMRERCYYDILDIVELPAAKGSYARLYLNGKPEGLYLLIDRYESPFWEVLYDSSSNSNDSSSSDDDVDDDDDDDDDNSSGGWNHYKHKKAMHKYKKKKHWHKKHGYSQSNKQYYDQLVHDNRGPIHGGLIHANAEDVTINGTYTEGSTLRYRGMKHSDYLSPEGIEIYKVIQESSTGDVMDALISFMSFIESTKSINLPNPVVEQSDIEAQNRLVEQWNAYFDVSVFLKNIALELILSNINGYCHSAMNYYLYQDVSQKGRFVYLPYNTDLILGSTVYPARNGTNPFEDFDRYGAFQYMDKRPLLKQILAVPLFNDRFQTILLDFYSAFFTTPAAGNYLRAIYSLVQADAGWDRALFRFRKSNFVGKEALHQQLIRDRLEKYPLGAEFVIRQDVIPFEQAVRGPIRDNPSLIGVYQHFNTTLQTMEAYIKFVQSTTITDWNALYQGTSN